MRIKLTLILIFLIAAFIFWLFFLSPENAGRKKRTLKSNHDLLQLAKQPEKYKNYPVTLKGIVANEPEFDGNGYHFQIFVPAGTKELNFIVDYKGVTNLITPESSVLIEGKVKGDLTAETLDNKFIRLARIEAAELQSVPKTEVLAPTLKRKILNLSKEDEKLRLNLKKVEFAATETRFYLTAINKSNNPVIFKLYDIVVLEGKKAVTAKNNLSDDYQQLPVELEPNSAASGILFFPSLTTKTSLKLVLRYVQSGADKKLIFTLPSD